MTKERREWAIKYINSCLKDGYMDLNERNQDELQVIKEAMNTLYCVEQFRWERDVAVSQLGQLGLCLGEKIDGVYFTKEECDWLKNILNK